MKQLESFFWGIIAALGALVVQIILLLTISMLQNPSGEISRLAYLTTTYGIILAALVEESFKYLIILKRIDRLSLEKSYIVNSLFVGLGFFSVELAFIYLRNVQVLHSLLPLGEILVIHMTTAAMIGYFIATKNPKKIWTFVVAVFFATFFHSTFNLLLNFPSAFTQYLVFALLGFLLLVTFFNLLRISKKLAA